MRAYSIVLAVSLSCLSALATRDRQVTIIFTGDILLDRGVRKVIEKHGADYLFSKAVDSVFHASDMVVGNLECPATKIKAPVQKQFIFRAEPEWLGVLRRHGITHLNMANNHTIDQGREGLMDTRRNVLKAGMTPIGADSTMEAASQPVLLAEKPRKIWLVASLRLALENFAYLENRPCVSQESMDVLTARINRLKQADPSAVVIVSLHWGGEHTLRPVPSQRLEAHRLIRAGADMLICHHTHTMQTVEHYQGKPIYYSIGNFIFDPTKPLNAKACIVKVDVTKDSVATTSIPVDIKCCVPYLQP